MIIGLGHRKRTGKDTVANYLVREHGFVRLAFADSLKEAAKIVFGWNDEHVNGELKEVVDPYWGFTPRWALQDLLAAVEKAWLMCHALHYKGRR